jgi:alpha-beta hydrolase superfamily lysophospholipase
MFAILGSAMGGAIALRTLARHRKVA